MAFYKYKSSHFYHLLRWLSTVWRISKLEHKPSGCEVAPVQMAACTLGHSLPALLDSRLLSQASTHWSIGLGLSSVTSPQLVPIILPISAKCHLLRTSSLTPLSTSTSAFLYSIPIFHHIHFFFPSRYFFNHNQQLSSLYIYLFISSVPSWNLSSMRTKTLSVLCDTASPLSLGKHHRYSNKNCGMNEKMNSSSIISQGLPLTGSLALLPASPTSIRSHGLMTHGAPCHRLLHN